MEWTGSPTKKASNMIDVYDENTTSGQVWAFNCPRPARQLADRPRSQMGLKRTSSAAPLPLTTAKFANRMGPARNNNNMAALPDDVFAKINAQQENLTRQKRELEANEHHSNSSSATDPYANTPNASFSSDVRPDAAEFMRLKMELQVTKEQMSQMKLRLDQSHVAQHTMEEALGSPFPGAQHLAANMPPQSMMAATGVPQSNTFPRTATPFEQGSFTMSHQPSFDSMRPYDGFSNQPKYKSSVPSALLPAPYTIANGINHQQQQPPVGTKLSPTAAEFGVGRSNWSMQAPPSYMSGTEPTNYRRLLDRNMSCNWKYIVDKIVCNNDQQASIFLQQKLKIGTADQKFEIVQAIIDQAYPLMVNRFGNFLVQRCFEHGTPEQVILIAQAIRGNTLNLSMDAFGCHVVQKAFDCVPEEYKAIMVHELLRRIPETVIHRYACHVWQKLFELRWSDSPPQIMKYVNEALRGMWHEVALGETGSLVVQNIFENCLEEDKRPCIDEVLASIDVVAHGQFGNWCIQHICEHGSIPDRSRAVEHVLRFATEYSMDQFASKVVEKCLKIGGADFLDRYLDRVCEARPDRPRMPLIDIAGDQFGNYLIQYILTNGDPERREIVANQIRKHMVSLRGSKYGSRVAMLCCNPAVSTRPGPPAGLPLTRNNSGYSQERFGGDYARSFPGPPDRSYVARGGYNGGGYR